MVFFASASESVLFTSFAAKRRTTATLKGRRHVVCAFRNRGKDEDDDVTTSSKLTKATTTLCVSVAFASQVVGGRGAFSTRICNGHPANVRVRDERVRRFRLPRPRFNANVFHQRVVKTSELSRGELIGDLVIRSELRGGGFHGSELRKREFRTV